jgi:hypothetical protein
MKTLLTLSFVLMSQLALAGGQDGSGGNICLDSTYRRFISLEEAQYSFPQAKETTAAPVLKSEIVDLAQTEAGLLALKSLRAYAEINPELSNALMELFPKLLEVKAIEGHFGRAYQADTLQIRKRCVSGTARAVLLTTKDGTVQVSRSFWNLLSVQSQHILLVHETIRFAQVLTDWGAGIDNRALQEMTALIVKGQPLPERLLKHNP